jgi:signal transduction histidine kinase/CheY-like chemotaxis protein/HPt (histidine-containing phosphotransfer) domain-containing protein
MTTRSGWRLGIAVKVAVLAVLSSAVTGLCAGWIAFESSREAALAEAQAALSGLVAGRSRTIKEAIADMSADLRLLARSPGVASALAAFDAGWRDQGTDAAASLVRAYVVDNPFPADARERHVAAGDLTTYDRAHGTYHEWLASLLEQSAYRDAYLVSTDGRVLYSARKEADFATDLTTGAWRTTAPARLIDLARSAPPDTVVVEDFWYYPVVGNRVVGFAAVPVDRDGRRLGYLMVQMPLAGVGVAAVDPTGLGENGDILILGDDGMSRSVPRGRDEAALLTMVADNAAIDRALKGATGSSIEPRFRGVDPTPVVIAYQPVTLLGHDWAIVAIRPLDEVLAPARAFGLRAIAVTSGAVLLVSLLAIGLGRRIARPIVDVTGLMHRLTDGDLAIRVPDWRRSDEVGALRDALGVFHRHAVEREELNRQLAVAVDRAEDAARAKAAFLATMSHEIRTPLNGVMSMAEILDQTALDGDQRGMTKVIRESATALLTVINDILDFSKIEAGRLDIEAIACDPGDLVESVGDLMAPKAEEKRLALTVEIDPDLPRTMIGDPNRIRQILLNLTSNAIKFTEHGAVRLACVRDGSFSDGRPLVRFDVIDSGIGLTAEQQGKLFQPFVQADSTTARKYGGTGLGLTICRRLADLMGGEIGLESAVGEGSRFWCRLPMAAVDAPLRPSVAINDLTVATVAMPAPLIGGLAPILAGSDTRVAAHLADVDAAFAWVGTAQPGTILIVPAYLGDWPAPRFLRELAARADLPVLVVAERAQASTLDEASLIPPGHGLTSPLRREAVWRALAIAAGRLKAPTAEDARVATGATFEAPDRETARAADALVLVAEDNTTNQRVIRTLFTRLGIAHDIAPDGRAALARLAEEHYGLLFTDFHMPEMDGFELTAEVRRLEAKNGARRLPIVALTADALPGTEQRCLDAGMDGYLTKPIETARLVQAIESHRPAIFALRRPAGVVPAPVAVAATPAPATIGDDGFPHADAPVMDLSSYAELFGDDLSALAPIVAEFAEQAAEQVTDIDRHLAAEAWTDAIRAAHALAGAALSAGAQRLGLLARATETALKDGNGARARELAVGLSGRLAAVRAAITAPS